MTHTLLATVATLCYLAAAALIGLRLAWYPGGTYFFSVNLLQRHGNGIRSKYMAGWCCRNICIA